MVLTSSQNCSHVLPKLTNVESIRQGQENQLEIITGNRHPIPSQLPNTHLGTRQRSWDAGGVMDVLALKFLLPR